jgi:hypothetical protein
MENWNIGFDEKIEYSVWTVPPIIPLFHYSIIPCSIIPCSMLHTLFSEN